MTIEDIELRFVERDLNPEQPTHHHVVRVLQWRKLVRSEEQLGVDNAGLMLIRLHDRWAPWQDVPMGREDAC